MFCVAILSVVALGCRQDHGTAAAKSTVVSKLDNHGRPAETTVYATNGVVMTRTLFETTDDGRVRSARTVDADGKLKWIDKYTERIADEGSSSNGTDQQRIKANGEAATVQLIRSPDGTWQKTVGGDGDDMV